MLDLHRIIFDSYSANTKYQCNHLKNKRNYTAYKTGTRKTERAIRGRGGVISLLRLTLTLYLDGKTSHSNPQIKKIQM